MIITYLHSWYLFYSFGCNEMCDIGIHSPLKHKFTFKISEHPHVPILCEKLKK